MKNQWETALDDHVRSAAGRAFWAMLRRMTLIAACVDVWYFLLFRYLGVPELAWPNVSSVALYLTAYALIRLRVNVVAVALIWIEVALHATAGTLLIGWESGFHYYMLLFVPIIVIGSRACHTWLLLSALFICYVGLDVSAYLFGATAPIPEPALALVRWTNMGIAFAMLSHAAIFYRGRLRAAEERIRVSATHDLLTGLVNQQHFMAMADYLLRLHRRSGRPAALAMLEIDQLQMPPWLQHPRAHRILVHVCHMLRKSCRQEDVMARWKGDQIVVLLPEASLDAALVAAARMRTAVAEHSIELHPGQLRCTVSMGLTALAPQEPFHNALLRAEEALERSRMEGRDCVQVAQAPPRAVHECGDRTRGRKRAAPHPSLGW